MFTLKLILFGLFFGVTAASQALSKKYILGIKALEKDELCLISDLARETDGWDNIQCNRYGDLDVLPDGTFCHVFKNQLLLEYRCEEGIWQRSTGTDIQFRNKRFLGLILGAVYLLISAAMFAVVCYHGTGSVICVRTGSDGKVNANYPRYTKCPPHDIKSEYIAASNRTSVAVSWTDPEATDDEELKTNIQTGGGKKGSEFLGNPSGYEHEITYTATNKYGLAASCQFKFKVKYLTCDAPNPPDDGKKDLCTHDNIFGRQCTFSCKEGFELIGKNTATCTEKGIWEKIPSCQRKVCIPPFQISNGKVECDNHAFQGVCNFICNKNFALQGQRVMHCQANQNWSVNPSEVSCLDSDPPRISCYLSQVFYADRGGFNTSVFWDEPTATDNVDTHLVIKKLSGITQGEVLSEGSHSVKYQTTDSAGNSDATLSQCTIILEVKVIRCSTGPTDVLKDSRFMNYTCSDTSFYNGVSCTLGCLLKLPLNGSDLMTCERYGNTDKGVWDWGSDTEPFCQVAECPALDPPVNGAYTTDSVLGRPVHVMLCKKGYDISSVGSLFTGWLSCRDNGKWFPLDAFPDCIVSSLPFLTLPAELYYEGDCSDEATKNAIKEQVLEFLQRVPIDTDTICTKPDTCKIENLEVQCGDSTKRIRRQTKAGKLVKRQVGHAFVSWNIKIQFDQGNKTTPDAYNDILKVFNNIKDAIQTDVKNGEFDIEGFTLPEDAFQTANRPAFECDTGYKREGVVCKPCPTGTYLNSTTGNCEYCDVGEYMDHEGALICDRCPDGFSTMSKGEKDKGACTKMCPAGFVSSSTMEPCSACSIGTFQPARGRTECQMCPQGTATNSTNSTSSQACQPFDILVGQITQRTSLGVFKTGKTSIISTSMWIKQLGNDNTGNLTLYYADSDGDLMALSSTDFVGIRIGTSAVAKTTQVLSSESWTLITTILDISASNVKLYTNGLLVIDSTGISLNSSRIVSELSIDIKLHANGVYLSGLSVSPRKYTSEEMTALRQTCFVTLGDEIITMSDILRNLVPGITPVMPTICDPIDECLNRTCGDHTCINQLGGFQCICHGEMTGVLCDIPPDYCRDNKCLQGDCIPINQTYTCSCHGGYTGVFCDKPPVDGGWSNWSEWNACSASCNGGTRSRNRLCDNPPPEYLGQNCPGDKQEHEACNTKPCPVCPKLKREYGTVVTCIINETVALQECNMTCVNGKILPNGQKPFEKYWCGAATSYAWMPIDKTPECVDAESPDSFGVQVSVGYDSFIPNSVETSVQNMVQDRLAGIGCIEQSSCDVTSFFNSDNGRGRRAPTSKLSLQFSVKLTDDGDLALGDYLNNGAVSPAMGELVNALQVMSEALEFIQNNSASIFDVTVGGVHYTVIDNSTDIVALVTCPDGMAGADGLCVKCAAGTMQSEVYCTDCKPGTYQPLTGQTECVPCPTGYTTSAYGASDVLECSVEVHITSTSENKHDDERGYYIEDFGMSQTVKLVVIFTSVAGFLFIVAAVGVVLWKKGSRKNAAMGSFISLSKVRPETPLNEYSDNRRRVFNAKGFHFKTQQKLGESEMDIPPAFESPDFECQA